MKRRHGIDMTEDEKKAYEKLHDKFELIHKKDTKSHNTKKSPAGKSVFSHTFGILKQRKYAKLSLISIAAFGILYSFLYGVWQIPVLQIGILRMSEITLIDIMYISIISVLAGLMVALLKYKTDSKSASGMAGAGGIFAGAVSTVCPVCQSVTFLALGSSAAIIPLGFLIPYLWVLQIAALFVLGLSLYMISNSIYTKTCIGCKADAKMALLNATNRTYGSMIKATSYGGAEIFSPAHSYEHSRKAPKTEHKKSHSGKEPFLYKNNIAFGALMVLVLMLAVNNFMITSAFATAGTTSGLNGGGSISIKPGFEYGPKVTLKPMPLATGESARFEGYRTIVKPLPTISELEITPSAGDVVQDLVNNVVPHGAPWYGQQAGVTFDDPIQAQQLWAKGRAIQLSPEEQKRWDRIVNSFTCDYCCGSPQNPTIITRCGCAHSQAAQGMAKWFIKNYGDKYSDEEIYGEMARWYALWYPGPTVKRIAQELEVAN